MRVPAAACLVLALACSRGENELDPRGGPTLDVTYLIGADECHESTTVEVAETATEVRLTAWERGNGGACPDIGIVHTETVTLAAPLGDRVVLDGATGAPVFVTPSPTPVR